ncbi:hypothetical protein L4X63_13115 [Geomonas sp. Red32]|uniref:hypothetical protein n=1 Tax=Geomonas sp. Red32 TaxID=2912856 RepID=UPI00202CC30D|nr:hypothetical protein [Geomonas sp. Red32]MCM0082533.1 hypothetical protein [Geomonas sp. Red32]
MGAIVNDENGFICECGLRNDYPSYVQDHRSVKLIYSCACQRQYILYQGTVTKAQQGGPQIANDEAFGD